LQKKEGKLGTDFEISALYQTKSPAGVPSEQGGTPTGKTVNREWLKLDSTAAENA
jgi:hypothetical protein